MKKTILLFVAAVIAVSTISCQKSEKIAFQFATNPFERAAEITGNIQTFAFVSPNDWYITWDEVEWVTIDQGQLNGPASKSSIDYHTVHMTVLPNRRNEDRQVQFYVNEGGQSHVMTIIEKKPVLPKEPLEFTAKDMNKPEGGFYEFSAPVKFEITVTSDSEWIKLGEIDYEENVVKFDVEPLPVDVTSRSGKITVSLSDGALLGTLTVNQAE